MSLPKIDHDKSSVDKALGISSERKKILNEHINKALNDCTKPSQVLEYIIDMEGISGPERVFLAFAFGSAEGKISV